MRGTRNDSLADPWRLLLASLASSCVVGAGYAAPDHHPRAMTVWRTFRRSVYWLIGVGVALCVLLAVAGCSGGMFAPAASQAAPAASQDAAQGCAYVLSGEAVATATGSICANLAQQLAGTATGFWQPFTGGGIAGMTPACVLTSGDSMITVYDLTYVHGGSEAIDSGNAAMVCEQAESNGWQPS